MRFPRATVFGVALAVRLAIVAWAAGRIPPAADGTYYELLARRLAAGQGYTWLWPDGAVTYAAHYPVGYPALVALGYSVLGPKPHVAMLLNAVIGAAGALAVWSIVHRVSGPKRAFAAGIAMALHPALVPYTAAIMTEGVTASLLVIAAAFAHRPRWQSLLAMGLVLGVATLVRPQSLVFAPLFGAFAHEPANRRARLVGAAVVTVIALAVCAPWTARNCTRMQQCALVSVNGGWNLAIGAQTETGTWQEIQVPDACRDVFHEAEKDACFGREARRAILHAPGRFLSKIPAKLRATFDYFGAAPWYLHTANANAFPYRAKLVLGGLETLVVRLILAAALVTVFRAGRWPAMLLASIGLVACVLVPGAVATVALGLGLLALGPGRSPIVPITAAVVLATAATHAIFFGAGRYGLVVVPFVTAIAFVRLPKLGLARSGFAEHASAVGAEQAIAGPRTVTAGHGREESPSSTERDAG
jgi:4-amino-4-deoxy-L-arabinose transferase-like glycosyltransferase